ncbi:MAG: alpha/beta hydrolase [Myxococcota bacterium]
MTWKLQHKWVRTECGEIAYLDEGTGPPIVLVHGAPLTSLGFGRVIAGLRDRHRVLALDLPGFGQSSPSDAFAFSLSGYAAAVVAFCRALSLSKFVLLGFDASGSVVLSAAAQLRASLSGIVLADTVPIPLVGRARLVRWILVLVTSRWIRWLNRRFNLLPWLVTTIAPFRRCLPQSARRQLQDQFATPSQRERILDWFSMMARDHAFMVRTAAEAKDLRELPTLILLGQFDPVRAVGAVPRFRALLPRARTHVIPWEEHFPILAEGRAIADEIAAWHAAEVR